MVSMRNRYLRGSDGARLAIVTLLTALMLAACGGGSSDNTSQGDTAPRDQVTDDVVEDAKELVDSAVEDTAGDAGATVVIDGTTYEFRALPGGVAQGFISFCTAVAGSLQGSLPLVDDSGALVEDAEIGFVFLEPNSLYASEGDGAEFELYLLAEESMGTAYVADEDDIDVEVSGRSASGTFTATDSFGNEVSGTVEVSC